MVEVKQFCGLRSWVHINFYHFDLQGLQWILSIGHLHTPSQVVAVALVMLEAHLVPFMC